MKRCATNGQFRVLVFMAQIQTNNERHILLPPPRNFISVNEKYKCKVEWQRIIYFFWQYTDFSIGVIQSKIFSFYATTKIFPFFFHSPINLFCLKKKKKNLPASEKLSNGDYS